MVRSGKLLGVVAAAALLVGCTVVAPPPEPSTTPAATAAVVRSCPDGLTEALEAHLATQERGGELPVEVVVTEFPTEMGFALPLADWISDCVFRTELQFSEQREFQIFGIVTRLGERELIAGLTAAGFEQPFPDSEPGAWETPGHDSIALYPDGGTDWPAAGFDRWAEFLEPGDVVILGSIGV